MSSFQQCCPTQCRRALLTGKPGQQWHLASIADRASRFSSGTRPGSFCGRRVRFADRGVGRNQPRRKTFRRRMDSNTNGCSYERLLLRTVALTNGCSYERLLLRTVALTNGCSSTVLPTIALTNDCSYERLLCAAVPLKQQKSAGSYVVCSSCLRSAQRTLQFDCCRVVVRAVLPLASSEENH